MSMQMEAKKAKNSRSLTTSLSIAFIALSVTVLLISGSFEIYVQFQTQRETEASKQHIIAQEAANTVANFIQKKFSILETAIKIENLSLVSRKEQSKILQILLGLQPAFRHLIFFDSQEQELSGASRLPEEALEIFKDRIKGDLFSRVKQGYRYVGPVYVDETTSEPLMTMAVPVRDIFKDFKGTLVAEVNLKFMWDLVYRLKIGETGLAYVVDKKGNLIAFGNISRVLRGENLRHLKQVDEFINNTNRSDKAGESTSTGINGTTVVGTYVPLGTPDWAVVTELSIKEAYGKVKQNTMISAGVMLVMAILAGFAGIHVARRLSVPLLNLTGTAKQITDGKIGLLADIEGPAEVAYLAMAFNNMTERLREMLYKEEERAHKLQQEIFQRQKAEEMLGESEKRYRSLVEKMNDGLAVMDDNNVFIYVNEKLCKMIGYSKDDILGRPGITFFDSENQNILKEQMKKRRRGESSPYELTWSGKDGSKIPAIMSPIALFSDDGSYTGSFAVITDITERKRAEEELSNYKEHLEELVEERTHELEAAQKELLKRERLAVLGQLTATVSHELRNPLGVINSSTFYLKRKLSDIDEKTAKHLARIDEQVNICDAIVGDLLEYTRGRHSEKVTSEINPWLQKLLADFESLPDVKVTLRLASDVPPFSFDPEKIRRVLVNLVTNAIQATTARSQQTIVEAFVYEPFVTISTGREADNVIIQVEDNGMGMDEETLKRAFEPLYTTRARGTGLGLALVEKIVSEHGGTVTLESRPNEGTKVRVVLPFAEKM